MAEGDAAFSEVVRGKLQRYAIACENPDAVSPQTPRQVGQHYAILLKLDAK